MGYMDNGSWTAGDARNEIPASTLLEAPATAIIYVSLRIGDEYYIKCPLRPYVTSLDPTGKSKRWKSYFQLVQDPIRLIMPSYIPGMAVLKYRRYRGCPLIA